MKYLAGNLRNGRSFTLVEVLVGIFLILIAFLSILGTFLFGLKVISFSRSKIAATAIANGEIEKIRNLDYSSVGVTGSFPDGVLQSSDIVIQSGAQFAVQRRVDYIADPSDGLDQASGDDCPLDYKRAEIKVSWAGTFSGQVSLTTDLSPKNLPQECAVGGGILSVSVFDAFGAMLSSPYIEIKDPATDLILKTATPSDGYYNFSLPAATYKVVVSKNGYSTERTYGADEVVSPDNPHLAVLEDKLSPISLSIDKLSNLSIDTLYPAGSDNFSDSFLDESKISEKSDVVIGGGEAKLDKSGDDYLPSGFLNSSEISPADFTAWNELSFSDSEPPNTAINYRIYFMDSGAEWKLIPDVDLPGNSSGLTISPIDLSGLSIATYSSLKISGNFSTSDVAETPTLNYWQISWTTSEGTPIPNAAFSLRGNKTIGKDINNDPVYKYSLNASTDSGGHKDLQNLEWDLYTFSVPPATGLNLANIDPSPQPINLLPDTTETVKLYLEAENSLLLTIQDESNSIPLFSASVRIYNTALGYDQTQYTNIKGQTYFIPLADTTYTLEISSLGYQPKSTTVSVSGYKSRIITLQQED